MTRRSPRNSEAAVEGQAIDRPLRILVVDDDELDRRAVHRCLQQSGVPVTAEDAASAEETLQRIGAGGYDCVLLDYYIPGIEGLALFKEIRDLAANLPVVIFTGRGDEDVAVELMKAGAADYLPKASLTAERLRSSLRHTMELSRAAAARRRAEQELRAQEARFRTLANAIPQLAWMADASGARTWFNDRWYDYTGTTSRESEGWGWRKVHHPDHVQRVINGMRRKFEAGEAWEDTYPLRGKDGTYCWFLSRALPVRSEAGSIAGWLGTNTDITERIESERAIHESEAKLRRITESGVIAVMYWTLDGTLTDANDEFCRMFGWSRADLSAGRVNWRVLTPPQWEELDRLKEAELQAHGVVTAWEKELYAKDGRRVPVYLAAAFLEGSTDRGVAVCFDISARKTAEAERERALALEQKARLQAERATRARDEVLAIVVHDLRNPMNTILTAATMIADTLDEPAERGGDGFNMAVAADLKAYNGVIRSSVKAMNRLISDLLDVARIEAGSFAIRRGSVDLRGLFEEALKLFEPQAGEREIALSSEIPPDIPPLSADRDRLGQVLANLLDNALKFTPAGGRVRLRARPIAASVQIAVEDSGPGIPAADLPHIFDRYWRADRTSRSGAGLGLAICKGIVDAHGGRIWVESALGRGTTFHLTVPRADR